MAKNGKAMVLTCSANFMLGEATNTGLSEDEKKVIKGSERMQDLQRRIRGAVKQTIEGFRAESAGNATFIEDLPGNKSGNRYVHVDGVEVIE